MASQWGIPIQGKGACDLMVKILGVASLVLWHRLWGDYAEWISCVWCHMIREMDRSPSIL